MLRPTIRALRRLEQKPGLWLALSLSSLLLAYAFIDTLAQESSSAQSLSVTAGFAGKETVAPDEQIELQLNRPVQPSEGRLGILIGPTDFTGLFNLTGDRLQYSSLPLPVGETELVVYLIAPDNEWREIARFPLRVAAHPAPDAQPKQQADAPPEAAHAEQPAPAEAPPEAKKRFGFDKLDFIPSLNVGVKSQFAETHFPESNRPPRPRFSDATIQGSLKTESARGAWNLQSQYEIVGSSFRGDALRFADQGENAPKVDLSNYLVQIQHGNRKFTSGHTTFGTHRHLINNFASRGLLFTMPVASRADFTLAATNSTSIVGFNNFFGLGNRRHQLLGGVFGFELLPKRPGGLRFEAGAVDAWFQPRNNVNQANINDTERSQGFSTRLILTDRAQRLRVDGGFTRSRFTNPDDPLLNQGVNVVSVASVTRSAHYVDAGYDILKEFALAENRKATLTLNLRHERVDPLFRSIGASVQADRLQNQIELIGTLGEATLNVTHVRFNDNLGGIPTILKTLTRRNAVVFNMPLAAFLSKDPTQPSLFLPRIGYTFDRTHAFAAFTPTGGGFDDPGAIPDQVNTNQLFTADWQMEKLRLGYRLNHSFQDNRQTGRERTDLSNLVNGFTIGWNTTTALDLNFDVNAESARNFESDRIDRTLRFGFGANWRMTRRATLAANFSTIGAGDVARTSRNRNIEADVQWSWLFTRESENRFKKMQTSFFIRYANRFARTRNNTLGVNTLIKLQTFNTGLNFIFF